MCATTTWIDEYLPVDVKSCPLMTPKNDLETSLPAHTTIIKNDFIDINSVVTTPTSTELIVNKYYFPGWHIYIDGKAGKINHAFSKYGIFKTTISPGKHTVRVVLEKTILMWVSDIISLLSLIAFLYYTWKIAKK